MRREYFLLIAAGLMLGCAESIDRLAGERASDQRTAWVDSTVSKLTLEEKVAQLMVAFAPGRYLSEESSTWQELHRLVSQRKIGGVYFSLGDVYEYAKQANRLQRASKLPLLIASDFEFGVGMRVKYSTTFPRAMAISATRNSRFAYLSAKFTAQEGRALGIHHNYAPDADINTNPQNPVINTRSFSDDPKLVSKMMTEYIKGLHEGGMISTVKHFPGHGDTDVDTHLGLSVLNFSKARLDSLELAPFRDAIQAGVMSVMVGHLAVPALDSTNELASSISQKVTTNLLKEELHFRGLVITDALRMQAVSRTHAPGEAAVLAVKAGADIILAPENIDIAIDAIVDAVRKGEFPESRVDESVRKILKAKQYVGLDLNRFVDEEVVAVIVGSREHQSLAREIARSAVTVLGNETNVLPLPMVDGRKTLDLVISDDEDANDGRQFHRLVQERRGNNLDFYKIDPTSNRLDYDSVLTLAKKSDVLIVQLLLFTRSGAMSGFIDPQQAELLKKLSELKKPEVVISFGNPYVAAAFPKADAYVCTYSDAEPMIQATAEVIFAQSSARGKLPVAIPERYKFGEGVEYPKLRLRDGRPEEVGINPSAFAAVDSIVGAAIRDSAFPSAVLSVARSGIVVKSEAYGRYDYSFSSRSVEEGSLYDLASVTKVIATTSAVMRLVDEGKLDLSERVSAYIPQFAQKGKENITVYNLMVHNSGLPAWRRFYDFCNDANCVLDSVYATPLTWKTGDTAVYSDLGLITMGKVIEKISGAPLNHYCDSVFFKPLGMKNTMYNPPKNLLDRIVPTEVDTFWKRTGVAVRGRVHDENAATLGGVSGHAGLFSTAGDLTIFLQMLLNGGTYGGVRFLKEETVKQFTARQSEKSSRGIGWDTKSSDRSFSGRFTSMKTYLHTGFTGTSVVVDPEKNLIIVFLTNRVYPTRSNLKIADVRPKVHDAILQALQK
jgi:beta-glucosidase-like glycosyl hydrolase/CubicO group peptidase (beta-lactamase class C family)